jgi:hypothetical protein
MNITCDCMRVFDNYKSYNEHHCPNRQRRLGTKKQSEIGRLRAWILFLGSQAPELKHYCFDALHTTQNPPEKS